MLKIKVQQTYTQPQINALGEHAKDIISSVVLGYVNSVMERNIIVEQTQMATNSQTQFSVKGVFLNDADIYQLYQSLSVGADTNEKQAKINRIFAPLIDIV